VTITGISLAIVALSFSTYLSLRSNLLYGSRTMYLNTLTHALQAKLSLPHNKAIYRNIAKEWFKRTKDYGNAEKIRTYSAASCLLSLISVVFAFAATLFTTKYSLWWAIPLAISIDFILLASLIHMKSLNWYFLVKYTGFRYLHILGEEIPPWEKELKKWKRNTRG